MNTPSMPATPMEFFPYRIVVGGGGGGGMLPLGQQPLSNSWTVDFKYWF